MSKFSYLDQKFFRIIVKVEMRREICFRCICRDSKEILQLMPAPEGIQGKPLYLHLSYFLWCKKCEYQICCTFKGEKGECGNFCQNLVAKSVNVKIFVPRSKIFSNNC